MSIQKCPVCNGSGHVPQGFYSHYQPDPNSVPVTQSAPSLREICRACGGRGILVENEEKQP